MAKRKKRNISNGSLVFITILGIIAVAIITLTLYIIYTISTSESKFFSISLIALFAGVAYEGYSLKPDREAFIIDFAGAYALSLITFIKGKHERIYDFEQHLTWWPYVFLGFFLLLSTITNKKKTIIPLTKAHHYYFR
ncbi:hypothetical protein [Flavobacterium rhizosphaerae]|uniref:Uncharacterized protein n=1 Tax=Flavobacterium rhizosphaerae TaxID=3163298 RepID=A0ABW8Z034_9FLAO